MKVVNEDIKNLERFIGNKNVEVHADLPLVMADAYNASKEAQKEIDKEMEEKQKTDAYVELNKVVGAEKQPVPDLPEEPKAVLDESLFEDFSEEEIEIEDELKEDLQDERIKNVKEYLEKALSAVNSYLERTAETESLEEIKDETEVIDEAKKAEVRDLFTQVLDDLSATNYNMKDKSKFPDMKLSDKYEDEDLGVAYRKDGFVDIDIRQDAKEKFDFAKAVADAYDVEAIGPTIEGDLFRLSLRIPE